MRAHDEIRVASRPQRAHQRRAGKAGVAGDVDSAVGRHRRLDRARAYNTRPQRRSSPRRLRNSPHRRECLPTKSSTRSSGSSWPSRASTLIAAAAAGLRGIEGRLLAGGAGTGARKGQRHRRAGRRQWRALAARAGALPRWLRADHRADGSREGERRAAGPPHVARRLPRRARRAAIGAALRGPVAEQLRGGDAISSR